MRGESDSPTGFPISPTSRVPPSIISRSWGAAGKGGKRGARRTVQPVRTSATRVASCSQRRQAWAEAGFAGRVPKAEHEVPAAARDARSRVGTEAVRGQILVESGLAGGEEVVALVGLRHE